MRTYRSPLYMVVTALAFVVAAPGVTRSQDATADSTRAEVDRHDVESIDAIIGALYDVISGPAGERDWDRFRSLFAPGAVLSAMVPRPDGTSPLRVFTYEDYVGFGGEYFKDNAFYDREAGRALRRFGNIANTMSFYESRHALDDPEPFARGINTITLVTDGARWYIVSIAWDEVREGNPLPAEWFQELPGSSN
ncbi:hypothetical protein BH18GEM1_BH18GEM1_03700 [soil metagenome]